QATTDRPRAAGGVRIRARTRPPGLGGRLRAPATLRLDAEAEGAQLLPAVVGDLVRAPRRHPDPVDSDVVHQPGAGAAGQGLARLVLDDVGQWARRRGQRHVEDGDVVVVDVDAVDQAQVHDVDPQLGVDDVAHGLLDVL